MELENGIIINVFSGQDSLHATGYKEVHVVIFRRPHKETPDVEIELTLPEARALAKQLLHLTGGSFNLSPGMSWEDGQCH